MRVTQLISSTGFYGAERVVTQLSSQLSRLGCEVTIALFDQRHSGEWLLPSRDGKPAVNVWDLASARAFDPVAVLRLARYLRTSKTDVLHTHGYKADLYGFLAARLASCKVVATCHNWTERSFLLTFYARLDRLVLRWFAGIVAVSDAVAERLRHGGVPSSRLSVILNGVDTSGSNLARSKPNHGEIVLLSIARLSTEKGLDVLLRALPMVVVEFSEMRCIIAGEGPERERLATLAEQLGVNDRVVFAGFCSDTESLLATSTVYVQPSRTEGTPLAVLEAMAAGCAIVASAVGGMPAVLRDGTLGMLVPSDDPKQLAMAILRLLRSQEVRAKLGLLASLAVKQRFNSSHMTASYFQLYTDVCHQGGVANQGIFERSPYVRP